MEAQNTNVYKKESEYQILKRARAMIGSKSQVTWQEVKTQIMKTKPECVESCPYMFQYLARFKSDALLDEVDVRIMKCMTAGRNLGADFWSSISKDAKSACGVLLRMRSYAISLAYTADERILGSDVRKMFSDEMKTVKTQDLTQGFEGLMFRHYQEIPEDLQAINWELQDALVRVAMQKNPRRRFPWFQKSTCSQPLTR